MMMKTSLAAAALLGAALATWPAIPHAQFGSALPTCRHAAHPTADDKARRQQAIALSPRR